MSISLPSHGLFISQIPFGGLGPQDSLLDFPQGSWVPKTPPRFSGDLDLLPPSSLFLLPSLPLYRCWSVSISPRASATAPPARRPHRLDAALPEASCRRPRGQGQGQGFRGQGQGQGQGQGCFKAAAEVLISGGAGQQQQQHHQQQQHPQHQQPQQHQRCWPPRRRRQRRRQR